MIAASLVRTLHAAARSRARVLLLLADGTRHSGRAWQVGLSFVVLDCTDGCTRRLELHDVGQVNDARDGRLLWSARTEATA